MSEWAMTLERLPASMNERERSSFWVRKRELDDITAEIGWLAIAERIPAATGRRFVQVTIHKGARSRVRDDPANRDSRAKSVLDALVRCGLLLDDNDAHLEWGGVVEGPKAETKRTVVVLRDVPPEAA